MSFEFFGNPGKTKRQGNEKTVKRAVIPAKVGIHFDFALPSGSPKRVNQDQNGFQPALE